MHTRRAAPFVCVPPVLGREGDRHERCLIDTDRESGVPALDRELTVVVVRPHRSFELHTAVVLEYDGLGGLASVDHGRAQIKLGRAEREALMQIDEGRQTSVVRCLIGQITRPVAAGLAPGHQENRHQEHTAVHHFASLFHEFVTVLKVLRSAFKLSAFWLFVNRSSLFLK